MVHSLWAMLHCPLHMHVWQIVLHISSNTDTGLWGCTLTDWSLTMLEEDQCILKSCKRWEAQAQSMHKSKVAGFPWRALKGYLWVEQAAGFLQGCIESDATIYQLFSTHTPGCQWMYMLKPVTLEWTVRLFQYHMFSQTAQYVFPSNAASVGGQVWEECFHGFELVISIGNQQYEIFLCVLFGLKWSCSSAGLSLTIPSQISPYIWNAQIQRSQIQQS